MKNAEKQSLVLPRLGRDWFGGKSSTRIATFFIWLRNSSGNQSNAFSAELMKSSRFILHHADRDQ